jgi:hypothetical protein
MSRSVHVGEVCGWCLTFVAGYERRTRAHPPEQYTTAPNTIPASTALNIGID